MKVIGAMDMVIKSVLVTQTIQLGQRKAAFLKRVMK
jgi:hypothetical protein